MNSLKRYFSFEPPAPYSAFLWGARKTGKSTYLKERWPKALYIDFLKPDVFDRYHLKPNLLREELHDLSLTELIVLDEVQKIPRMLDEVHWMIENMKGFQFILCGSSVRKLKQSGSNLLGGRAWRYQFLPFCFPELKELNWPRICNHGLLPSHYLSNHPKILLSSYLMDYLLPEVHHEANIRNQQGFARFMDALGFCQGEMLNFTNIARDCGIDAKTVRSYFDILVDMYIGYYVLPYRRPASRQTVRDMPKFYLMDTGIANFLKRYTFTEWRGTDAGKVFEHYIFLELMAYKLLNHHETQIEYWRTKDGAEVDFVLEEGHMAIETKISTSSQQRDLKGLVLFGQEYGAKLNVVGLEPRKRVMQLQNQQITVWPVQEFLEALWGGRIV